MKVKERTIGSRDFFVIESGPITLRVCVREGQVGDCMVNTEFEGIFEGEEGLRCLRDAAEEALRKLGDVRQRR